MEKYITIDHPFTRVTLEFPLNSPKPLSPGNWEMLTQCEMALYREYGTHAWTDVMFNDGNAMLNEMWDQARIGACGALDENHDSTEEINRETARRVAAALAVLSFGKEFLLK